MTAARRGIEEPIFQSRKIVSEGFKGGLMRRLPVLTMSPRESEIRITSFLGINKGTVIRDNEFADMKNMSSECYPAIATRKKRGKIQKTIEKPHGLYYKNGLVIQASLTRLFAPIFAPSELFMGIYLDFFRKSG